MTSGGTSRPVQYGVRHTKVTVSAPSSHLGALSDILGPAGMF